MNITRPYWWLVNIGSGNGLVLSGNKPLPERILTQVIWHHIVPPDHNEFMSWSWCQVLTWINVDKESWGSVVFTWGRYHSNTQDVCHKNVFRKWHIQDTITSAMGQWVKCLLCWWIIGCLLLNSVLLYLLQSWQEKLIGHVPWQVLLGLLSWNPILKSSNCTSFDDLIVDFIYGAWSWNELRRFGFMTGYQGSIPLRVRTS